MVNILEAGRLLPKSLISYGTGWLARLRLPGPLARVAGYLFIKLFGIDMSEAEHPPASYRTIEDIFTRKLKTGLRPADGRVVSPADGILSMSAPAQLGRALQAKGLWYSLDELVFGRDSRHDWQPCWYFTVYLAPHNYHRVHAPVSGRLVQAGYFPGELWPVNQPFVRFTRNLFCRNERLVFELETENGGRVYVVMVGALNVGRISARHIPDFVTNGSPGVRVSPVNFVMEEEVFVQAGDELGTFMLGSTVVTVFDRKSAEGFSFYETSTSTPIKMGQSLLNAVKEP